MNEEIRQALETAEEDIPLEKIADIGSSPLMEPVREKNPDHVPDDLPEQDVGDSVDKEIYPPDQEEPTLPPIPDLPEGDEDLPEQEIFEHGALEGDGFDTDEDVEEQESEEPPVIPTDQDSYTARNIIESFNNLIAVGGGFFLRIKKHESFYEFEEVMQVIEDTDQKNIKRIQLTEVEKMMLAPLLAQVLAKKRVKLTPEMQLLLIGLSICGRIIENGVMIHHEAKDQYENFIRDVEQYKVDEQGLETEEIEEPTDTADEETAGAEA